MSQHGCPERLSNRSKAFQEDGPSQPTMELMVETLTGTAFEMTVSPSDTIFAIKSKIFRVEGIPVSQQHLLYNLRELDDALSLREHSIGDGARLRLVLGLRGGPMATRRLPPPEPWRDIERLLHPHRGESEWGAGSSDCKVTVLVIREGERVNMVRVVENRDGSYSPLEQTNYSSSLSLLLESEPEEAGGAQHENAVTMGKMMDLRRRMEALSLQRRRPTRPGEKPDIQKTRSEETLSVRGLLYEEPLDGYRYEYDCGERYLLQPIGTRARSDHSVLNSVQDDERVKLSEALAGSILVKEDGAILEECLDDQLAANLAPLPAPDYGGVGVAGAEAGGVGGWRAFGSSSQLAPPPLAHALFSSSTSDLEALRRNRILPALSRHRNREHLHLSDEGLDLPRPPRSLVVGSERRRNNNATGPPAAVPLPTVPAPPPPEEKESKPEKKLRLRCGFCKKRLSIATVHKCRCGAQFCAPHRYAEVHGCAYDYKQLPAPPPLARLPRI